MRVDLKLFRPATAQTDWTVATQRQSPPHSSAMNTNPGLSPPPPSLLVVEDDAVLNQLLVSQLQKVGYDVVGVHSWAQARTALQRVAPDMVLLDVNLPDSKGFEPLIEIAAARPVVMLTAFGGVNQAVQAMQHGAADYLLKPVNLDELELVIHRTIEQNQLRSQKEWLNGSHRSRRVPGCRCSV